VHEHAQNADEKSTGKKDARKRAGIIPHDAATKPPRTHTTRNQAVPIRCRMLSNSTGQLHSSAQLKVGVSQQPVAHAAVA
jgi:hypothetical protein